MTGFSTLFVGDYPTSASFLGALPPWPVSVACNMFQPNANTSEQLASIAAVMQLNYNYTAPGQNATNPPVCFDLSQTEPSTLGDDISWNYQACSEMILPSGQYGMPNDFFYSAPWDLDAYSAQCQLQYGVQPRSTWIPLSFGMADLESASNIFFSNGNLDPWSGGGVKQNISASVVAYIVDQGAHHLDLRASSPNDPPSVIYVRNMERYYIRQWLGLDDDTWDKSSIIGFALGLVVLALVAISAYLMFRESDANAADDDAGNKQSESSDDYKELPSSESKVLMTI